MLSPLVFGLLLAGAQAVYITELSDGNFFEYAKDKDVLLVDFYAPWCGDCVKLAPEFDKAAGQLGARSTNVAKVDCFGAGKGLCQMYGVRSWPQLKNFNKGTFTGDYTGAQTGEAMAAYVNTVQSAADGLNAGQQQSNPYAAAVPVATPAYAAGGKTAAEPAKPVTSGVAASAKCEVPPCKSEEVKPAAGSGEGLIRYNNPVIKLSNQTSLHRKKNATAQQLTATKVGSAKTAAAKTAAAAVADSKLLGSHQQPVTGGAGALPLKVNATALQEKAKKAQPVAPRFLPDDKRHKIIRKVAK